MKRVFYRLFVLSMVFFISFIGVRQSSKNIQLGTVKSTITIISLGNEAKAYCNEATRPGEVNTGRCTGAFDQWDTRCLAAVENPNCSS